MFSFGDEVNWQELKNGRYHQLLAKMKQNADNEQSCNNLSERIQNLDGEDRLVAWQQISKTTH